MTALRKTQALGVTPERARPKWEVALMLSEFLFYLMGILATLGGVLLLERIVAGPHSTAGTGYARVDTALRH